ncbi:MAG: 1-deoxy-D-xylulose-5-phosphate synthase [Alistipes sp.]|jgi:1-deoxy-D-xylulose-5-phosphate synthase|nr:1-deoxy-D-xylulose-5-phosphate synthase [Alistipes sp.]
MEKQDYKYMNGVDSPADLKRLSLDELPAYCGEVRRFIIESVARAPGHLASSLGAVELSVAIHYVFDTPNDKIVWDVGHQAYAHKIVTGRRDAFSTLRKSGGIAGFPRPGESPYDPFIGGHSSTSISAALGFSTANRLAGRSEHVVAVIGDGAMTGGLAFEGLNNAGASKSDLLVVLNDNRISIDRNTGGLADYLVGITTSERYNRFKMKVWNMFPPGSSVHNALKKTSNALKHGLLQQSNLFESFGFRYFGPVDGHDVVGLVKVLRDLKRIGGPKLLHTVTMKGKGYTPAELDQPTWHAPGPFDPRTGRRAKGGGEARWQDVFGETLVELARADGRIVGITPAMPTGSSLNLMMEAMPARAFDVGIAEGHAVTFAAGLAAAGMVPFCTVYSSFLQRAYDNVIHDVAIERLGVVLCVDRGGLVGEDGTTHQGVFDIAALLPVPGMVISSPMDEEDMRSLMYTASRAGLPFVIRYPRGNAPGRGRWRGREFAETEIGRGRCLRGGGGGGVAVLSFGPVGNFAAEAVERAAGQGVGAAHYDLRFAKPLDGELLHEVGRGFGRVITVEDGAVSGGVGGAVSEFFAAHGYSPRVEHLGVPDRFIPHGTPAELYRMCGFDTEGILAAILKK